MLSRKALAIASLCTIVCTQAGIAAEAFNSSKVLTYSTESQNSYIASSAMMAGLIASQNSASQASCIDDWGAKQRDAGYAAVLDAMRRFPEHHPSAVIIAVLDKACGAFKYSKP